MLVGLHRFPLEDERERERERTWILMTLFYLLVQEQGAYCLPAEVWGGRLKVAVQNYVWSCGGADSVRRRQASQALPFLPP
jgi:hypothetical protein